MPTECGDFLPSRESFTSLLSQVILEGSSWSPNFPFDAKNGCSELLDKSKKLHQQEQQYSESKGKILILKQYSKLCYMKAMNQIEFLLLGHQPATKFNAHWHWLAWTFWACIIMKHGIQMKPLWNIPAMSLPENQNLLLAKNIWSSRQIPSTYY